MMKMTSHKITVFFCAIVLLNLAVALGNSNAKAETRELTAAKKKGAPYPLGGHVSKFFFSALNKLILNSI